MANGTLAASQIEMLSLSGTGIITITPPATNTNRAITLPDAAGAIVVSGTTPSLNGITFPATQSASADANTLDDYEEGTWTPSIGGNATYQAGRSGIYTKIGNIVTCQFQIPISIIGTGSQTTVTGFPFTSANIGSVQTGSVSYYESLAISTIFVSFYIGNNSTSAIFATKAASGTTVDNAPNIFGNSTNIYGAITYRVA